MHVIFDRDFDGGAWPGPLTAGRVASAGEAWVGSAGLLNLVETALGTRLPMAPESRRLAQLAKAVTSTEGFWSASAAVDPLGVARRLLHWADTLRMYGWRGQGVSPRIAALARLVTDVEAGFSNRLQAAADGVQSERLPVRTVMLFEALEQLPFELRRLFEGLRANGTDVQVRSLDAVQTLDCDLARARSGERFTPTGDGSLQLVRPYGTLEAAEVVAAALATFGSLEGTVVIGGDKVLDAALRRHGLPVLGAAPVPLDNAVLQLLPLTLAMGFGPQDPQRALELLTLPVSPIRRDFARRLARALHKAPAVDSDVWRAELQRSFEKLTEDGSDDAEDAAEVVAERLKILFTPDTLDGLVPLEAVRARTSFLSHWLHGRLAFDEKQGRDVSAWGAAIAQVSTFETLITLGAPPALSPVLVARFVEEANRAAPPSLGARAEAGLRSIDAPGAVTGRCERVIWWGFDLESAVRPRPWPFTDAELAALGAAGVRLPDTSSLSVANAARWRRPLELTARQLVLVCPKRTESGDERHPHPLWDEVTSRIARSPGSEAALARLVRDTVAVDGERQVPLAVRPEAALPIPTRTHRVDPSFIRRRDVESPSSAATLIACSLKWTLDYLGNVKGGATAKLPQAQQLLGNLSHVLLAKLLLSAPDVSPQEAKAEAERLFDTEGPRLAAPLFLPGGDAQRGEARTAVANSALELYGLLRDGRLKVFSVERPFAREAFGTTLEGTPDLVVEDGRGRKAIIDLKWSGLNYRRGALVEGTAHQLAAYGFLLQDAPGVPLAPGAFFILNQQVLLTTDGATFPDGVHVEGPGPAETWRATVAAHGAAWGRLAQGVAEARILDGDGRRLEPEDDQVEAGSVSLKPPCDFCDYAAICGAAFAQPAEQEEEA